MLDNISPVARVPKRAKASMYDEVGVKVTCWAPLIALKTLGRPGETNTGLRTEWNWNPRGIVKTDALNSKSECVMRDVNGKDARALCVKCTGKDSRC